MDKIKVLERLHDHITESGFELGENELAISPYGPEWRTRIRLTGHKNVYTIFEINEFEGKLRLHMDACDALVMYFTDRAVERCVANDKSADLPETAFKYSSPLERALYEIGKLKPHIGAVVSETTQPRQAHVNAVLGPLKIKDGKITIKMELPDAVSEGLTGRYRKLGEIIDLPDCPEHLLEEVKNTGCVFQREGSTYTTMVLGYRHLLDDSGLPLSWHKVEQAGRSTMQGSRHYLVDGDWERSSARMKELYANLSAATEYDIKRGDNVSPDQRY